MNKSFVISIIFTEVRKKKQCLFIHFQRLQSACDALNINVNLSKDEICVFSRAEH